MFGNFIHALLNKKNNDKNKAKAKDSLSLAFSQQGIYFSSTLVQEDWYFSPKKHDNWQAVAVLAQWLESGYCETTETNQLLINWQDWYNLTHENNEDYAGAERFFSLPPASPFALKLNPEGTFSDRPFYLTTQWRLAGRWLSIPPERHGGSVRYQEQTYLLKETEWQLLEAIQQFPTENPAIKNTEQQQHYEAAWGRIRPLAIQANVDIHPVLFNTIIVTAEQLDIELVNHGDNLEDIEIQPMIPTLDKQQWLSSFDKHWHAQKKYEWINNEKNRIKVILTDDVYEIISTIKKMPNRRVTGALAERFLRNPAHVLGESAEKVLSVEKFEQVKQKAGIRLISFNLRLLRLDATQLATGIQINFVDDNPDQPHEYPQQQIETKASVTEFFNTLKTAIHQQALFLTWHNSPKFSLDNANHWISILDRWLTEEVWQEDANVDYIEFYDISNYAKRVIGVGEHQPQYTPYIAKSEKSGWMPKILLGEETGSYIKLDDSLNLEMKRFIDTNPSPESLFQHPHLPKPMTISEVKNKVALHDRLSRQPKDISTEDIEPVSKEKTQHLRQVLQIYQNIISDDYIEKRNRFIQIEHQPILTRFLSDQVKLKQHQLEGLSRLQHLHSQNHVGVKGVLMADDMGLGKTLQLLSFIMQYFEQHPTDYLPAMVVAPVSLLENWQGETQKFFTVPDNWVFSLHGDTIQQLRNRLTPSQRNAHKPDEEGKSQVPGKILPKDWLPSNARIILTTYETIRDYEFTLGMIEWSFLICDEAQKIKTPSAQVTHAVKAMNAQFKIACTGTPVENSLTDLWCLFDFIQPGLLGSLSEFYKNYRKAIETKSIDKDEKIEALRKLIDVQTIRRLKTDVAKDLPKKIETEDCLELPLSRFQKGLYQDVADWYKNEENKQGAALKMLHRLRGICAEPVDKIHNGTAVIEQSLSEHLERSPKMRWLLETLKNIQLRHEKVIIFTEFKDIQRILQHRIEELFQIKAAIVNGDSPTAKHSGKKTRQQIINQFQQSNGFNIIILSPVAVGYGVNIQSANHVIHYTRTWNPAKEDQATDRAYRIGQEKDVHVYYPTVTSNAFETFEAKLHQLISDKRDLGKDMLNGVGDISIDDLSTGIETPDGEVFIERKRISHEDLVGIQPIAFEKLIANILIHQGYVVEVTGQSGDHGVDVVAIKGDQGILVQCKTSSATSIGIHGINEVVGGSAHYRVKLPNIDFKLAVATNTVFNKTAIAHANNQQPNVELWDYNIVKAWLDNHKIFL